MVGRWQAGFLRARRTMPEHATKLIRDEVFVLKEIV